MIVIGTPITTFAMDRDYLWSSWLRNAEIIKRTHDVKYFAAIEVDSRGIEPFFPLIKRLLAVGGDYWTYMYDDRRTSVNSENRINHICMGRNIIQDYAAKLDSMGMDVTHILHLDADLTPHNDTIPMLLEMGHPLVGGDVSQTYCGTGPRVDKYDFPVEEHLNTAGYLLVARDLYSRLRWRKDHRYSFRHHDKWGTIIPMGDDQCYYYDALTLFNIPTYVRKDCIGQHNPPGVAPFEMRGYDASVRRDENYPQNG
jgi:hypothetical protein